MSITPLYSLKGMIRRLYEVGERDIAEGLKRGYVEHLHDIDFFSAEAVFKRDSIIDHATTNIIFFYEHFCNIVDPYEKKAPKKKYHRGIAELLVHVDQNKSFYHISPRQTLSTMTMAVIGVWMVLSGEFVKIYGGNDRNGLFWRMDAIVNNLPGYLKEVYHHNLKIQALRLTGDATLLVDNYEFSTQSDVNHKILNGYWERQFINTAINNDSIGKMLHREHREKFPYIDYIVNTPEKLDIMDATLYEMKQVVNYDQNIIDREIYLIREGEK